MTSFQWIGFKTLHGISVVFPMTRWIVPANDEKFSNPKKY